jgi:hypothetical protein
MQADPASHDATQSPYDTLNELFKAHPPSTLKEMDIVPPMSSENDLDGLFSPFLLMEGNLGVPANVIPEVYKKAYKEFFRFGAMIRNTDKLKQLGNDGQLALHTFLFRS